MSEWPFAPVKKHMTVYPELPLGVLEQQDPFIGHREAKGYVNGEYKAFYFCPKCGGWIEGYTGTRRVNTLAPLSGRSGRAEYCQRCQYELSFVGIVS